MSLSTRGYYLYGSIILVEGQEKGQNRLCTDFHRINTMSTQCSYLLPSITEIVDIQRGHDLWCLLDLKSGFYNALVMEHA